tara:strand:+ start:750 stop:1091 length:342 start_codon:yes stop_codon:yes gene_type:complete
MLGMKDNPVKKLKIERWAGGWHIINDIDPMEIKSTTFLTFQEAYDIYERMKGTSNGHRERTKTECEGITGTIEPVSQENKIITGRNIFSQKKDKSRGKFWKWYEWLGFNGRSQ